MSPKKRSNKGVAMKFHTYFAKSWSKEEKEGVDITLMSDKNGRKEILINMAKGALMKDHKAPGAIMVHVLKGEIDFGIEAFGVVKLKELDSIELDPLVVHNLTALEHSLIRLSLSVHDDFKRVEGVLDL